MSPNSFRFNFGRTTTAQLCVVTVGGNGGTLVFLQHGNIHISLTGTFEMPLVGVKRERGSVCMVVCVMN